MAYLSKLTHCLARIYIPSFEQCKQIRATLARCSLCGTGVARANRRLVFSGQEDVQQKKKGNKEKEGKTFRSERTVNLGPKPESTISEPKSLCPFPFLCAFHEHVEASTSWVSPCVCTLTSAACAVRHLDVFGCRKQT